MAQGPGLEPADLALRVGRLKGSRGKESFQERIAEARRLYKEGFARQDTGEQGYGELVGAQDESTFDPMSQQGGPCMPRSRMEAGGPVYVNKQIDWAMFEGLDIGIRVTPVSWDQLLKIMAAAIGDGDPEEAAASGRFADEEALGALGRSPAQLKAYYDYRDDAILKRFASTDDYLLVKVFGVPATLTPGGLQAAALPPDFHEELRVVFRENDFPYYFEEGIEDHTLWANRPLSPWELQQAVAAHRPRHDVVYYVNPPSLMSVPAIWHAHVISRRRPDAVQSL
ncbi:hypothetical protein N2152v2_000301 [Parachlorella kessleri]